MIARVQGLYAELSTKRNEGRIGAELRGLAGPIEKLNFL